MDEVFSVFNNFNCSESVTVANAVFSPSIRAQKVTSLTPALHESQEQLTRFYSRCWSESVKNTSQDIDITIQGKKVGQFRAFWKCDFGNLSSSIVTKVDVLP